jgi:Sel1 repeat
MALMYLEGQGVAQDDAEAVKWFRLSADQGIAEAQYNLGLMFLRGRGIPQDYVAAYMWFNLSAAQGDQEGAAQRDQLALRMNAAQIANAQELAREWKPITQTVPPPVESKNEDEASAMFDAIMIWSVCQTFAGTSDVDALTRAGKEIFPKIISGLQKTRPEMVQTFVNLAPHTRERYAKQLLFLRALSRENRDTICWGVDQNVEPFLQ